jgi:hypothetical protein
VRATRPRREVHQLEPAYGSRRDEPLVADEECDTRLRLSCRVSNKGQRQYDWLLIDPGADTHPCVTLGEYTWTKAAAGLAGRLL